MSDETGSNVVVAESTQEQPNKESSEFVSKSAYEEVSADMHKYKRREKEKAAKLAELETKLKQQDEDKLAHDKKWEELAIRREQELSEMKQATEVEKNKYSRSIKLNALKSELGKVKDAYLSHADIDSIDFNEDGTVNSDSVLHVANEFRKEHSQLIPASSNSNIAGHAASSSDGSLNETDMSKLSAKELAAEYTKKFGKKT